MKYIAILAIVVLMVRVDFIMGLVDKYFGNEPPPADVSAEDISSKREVISVKQDVTLKQSPRQTFMAFLEDFRTAPVPEIRNQAISILKSNPKMFGPKLDTDLEARVFNWTELISNNEPEVVNFLLDLMGILQGENQEMLKRFFSSWMQINMEQFIAAYSRTKDSNCSIATTFPSPLPAEELLNEYYEREEALANVLAKEKLDPVHRVLAQNCKLVVTIQIDKLEPKTAPLPLPYLDPNAIPVNTSPSPEPQVTNDPPVIPVPTEATPATPAATPSGGVTP